MKGSPPRKNLYADVLKKNKSLEIQPKKSNCVTPGKPPVKQDSSRGYRVHRPTHAQTSVRSKPPTEEQHCGPTVNKLLFCTDVLNCNKYLVDTGASVSIINYSPNPNENYDQFLCQADGSPVKTYGAVQKTVRLGDTDYNHVFIKADVDGPVIGSDFLSKHKLLVDCHNGQLIPQQTYRRKSQQQPIVCVLQTAEEAEADQPKVCCPEYLRPLLTEFSNISGAQFSKLTPKQEGTRGDH